MTDIVRPWASAYFGPALCRCSDMQLNLVGCECPERAVAVLDAQGVSHKAMVHADASEAAVAEFAAERYGAGARVVSDEGDFLAQEAAFDAAQMWG